MFLLLFSDRTSSYIYLVFFFTATATTEIYTLSLHDALPISTSCPRLRKNSATSGAWLAGPPTSGGQIPETINTLMAEPPRPVAGPQRPGSPVRGGSEEREPSRPR